MNYRTILRQSCS